MRAGTNREATARMTQNNPYPVGSADHLQFETLRQLEQLLAIYTAGSKPKTRRRSSGTLSKMIAEAVARDTR